MAKSFFNIWPFITSKNSTFAKVGSTLFCQILNRKPFKRCPRLLKFRQRSENSPNQVTRTVGLLPFYVHYVVSMLSRKIFPEMMGCGMIINAAVDPVYVSRFMTIQFCVEVCRGAGQLVAALQVGNYCI